MRLQAEFKPSKNGAVHPVTGLTAFPQKNGPMCFRIQL